LSNIDLETTPYDPWTAYSNSKLANILFAKELNRRYKSEGIVAVSVHPGMAFTGLQRHMAPTDIRSIAMYLMSPFLFKTISQAAATTVYAVVSIEIEQYSGRYFEDCHISTTSFPNLIEADELMPYTYAAQLWKMTDKLIDWILYKRNL
jgi:NAD(P)-dependent dehydrogenase (short-subunit alcohol dehydrogenase family)